LKLFTTSKAIGGGIFTALLALVPVTAEKTLVPSPLRLGRDDRHLRHIRARLGAGCDRGMSSHVSELTLDVEAGKQLYVPEAAWSAEGVGYFM
jgi:alkylhydroperoxidase family enzyme